MHLKLYALYELTVDISISMIQIKRVIFLQFSTVFIPTYNTTPTIA